MPVSDELRRVLENAKPIGVPGVPCVECEPHVDELHIVHEPMCPVAICIEDITQKGRQWFELHPFADSYYREITWGEGLDILLVDERSRQLAFDYRVSAVGKVRVDRMSDIRRARRFEDVYYILEGEKPK